MAHGLRNVAFGLFLFCLQNAVSGGNTPLAYCPSYCDVEGYYRSAKHCVSTDVSTSVYCCGHQTNLYCCTDEAKDVGDMYPPVNSCPGPYSFQLHWQIVISLLTTLLIMLIFAACCYYCCSGDAYYRRRSLFGSRRNGEQDVGVSSIRVEFDGADPPPQIFDPDSPCAFSPPAYESLPKDPPKYCDLFNPDGGVTNPAFHSGEEGEAAAAQAAAGAGAGATGQEAAPESEDPCPPYTPQIESSTRACPPGDGGSGTEQSEDRQSDAAESGSVAMHDGNTTREARPEVDLTGRSADVDTNTPEASEPRDNTDGNDVRKIKSSTRCETDPLGVTSAAGVDPDEAEVTSRDIAPSDRVSNETANRKQDLSCDDMTARL